MSNLDAIGDASYLHHWAMRGKRSPEVIAALDESLERVTAALLAIARREERLRLALEAAEYGLDLAIEQRSDWQEESQEALNTVRAALTPEEGQA